MDLAKAMMTSASGLRAQSARMRVISENLANQESVANTPGGDPYRRKIIQFSNIIDREMGVPMVRAHGIEFDQKEFDKKYDPGNPAADEAGYVLKANVNGLVEMMDMREAQRSYQSNLNALETARKMASMTVDLLRKF